MQNINKILGLCLTACLLLLVNPAPAKAQPGASVSFQTFYNELQPYGTWVDDPNYGDVWIPNVDEDFKPYATNGHWIVTEYGNTWESDYEWGWAPFHYGRWRFDDYYGWEWIPGSEWGPAWVNWRTGGGYYAWAPLGPRVSIDVSFGNDYNVPNDYWMCAPYAYITSPRIYDYYVPRARVVNVIRNTTIINNVYVFNNRRYVTGPRVQDIERYTNSRVNIYRVNDVNDPRSRGISDNAVNIYRPNISRGNYNSGDRPRPERVVDADAYRNAHPNEGLGNHNGNNGAVVNHNNAFKLAQTARDNRPDNGNVVRITRQGGAPNANNADGNNATGSNNGRFNRPGRPSYQSGQQSTGTTNNNQPTQANPTGMPSDQRGQYGRYNRNRSQQSQGGQSVQQPVNNGQPAQVNPVITTTPANPNDNNGRFNRNRGQQNNAGQRDPGNPGATGQPVTTPVPNTTISPSADKNNGSYRGGRFDRPIPAVPVAGNTPQQQNQPNNQQEQQRRQMQERQQQAQQNPQANQQRQQQQAQQQQAQQRAQQQAQQQQKEQQQKQQRPQIQPDQQKAEPLLPPQQARPQRGEQHPPQ